MQISPKAIASGLNPRHSLKARVGWATIGSVILLSLLLSLIAGQVSHGYIIRSKGEFFESLAFQMADKLDRGMFERYKDIQILASLDDIRQADVSIEVKRSLIETLQTTYSDYAWIGLTDANGIVLASTGKLLEGKSTAERPWFQQGRQAPFAGDVHEALLLEKLLKNDSDEPLRFVDVAAPVVDEAGVFQGVLGAHLSWQWAREVESSLLDPLEQPNQVEFLILSKENRVLLGPRGLREQSIHLDSLEKAAGGFLTERWPNGESYLTGFSTSYGYRDFKGLGWTTLVRQPVGIALAPARFLQRQVFAWGAILGSLFSFASWVHTRRIVRGILSLTSAADHIQTGKGQVTMPLLSGQDELSALSASFHHLVQTLNVRTRSLSTANEYLQRDLIEQQQSEDKIREQAALLDIATDAIFVRDLDGIIQYWNRGAETIYGWRAAEACGQNALKLLNPTISETLTTALSSVVECGEWKGELPKRTRSGKEIMVSSRWTLVCDQRTARPKAILTVDTDVTEAKQLEAQLLRVQRLESLGTLSSGIAHDLNNVLTPIMGAAQLLPMTLGSVDHRSEGIIKTLYSSAKRASDMVKQILAFARGNECDRKLVQIKHILKEVTQVLEGSLSKNITIQKSIEPDLWPVLADATQVQQVIMNLCINAGDAMPKGGTLTLAANNVVMNAENRQLHPDAKTGPYVLLSVADTGVGMSEAVMNRIFEPFFTTKEIGKGTGLGLSTTVGIVKSHGGFIKVNSEEGKSSKFQIYLPAQESDDMKVPQALVLPMGHHEMVLVVDDEILIQEMTKTALESFDYQVVTASNGYDAITQYTQHQKEIRVVLIDMMMPVLNGEQVIQALDKINPNVKVIAMSGLDISKHSVPNIQTFLPKPFSIKDLLVAIEEILYSAA